MDLSWSIAVAHIAMTVQARRRFAQIRLMDLGQHRFVALNAIIQSDLLVEVADLDWIGEIAGCESQTVVPPVDPFDDPLVGEGMGRVAIVAGGNRFVAGMIPAIELIAHDMAVDTSLWIVGKIG
jgi:hypothetical protein